MGASTRRQRAAKLRLVPKPSVPARPSPVFARERFYDVVADIKPLLKRHWDELGRDKDRVPLDFWWEQWAALDASGIAHILTVRLEGELIGYIFALVSPHLHYKTTLHAAVDMYYLLPEHRLGWTGVKMFRAWEAEMKRLGVKRVALGENLSFKGKHNNPATGKPRKARSLFEALGYRATDIQFRKML